MDLRLCALNLENLFVSLEYFDGRDLEAVTEEQWRGFALAQHQGRQKPLAKLRGLASAIAEIRPDILLLSEVGGPDSLQHFNRLFLADQFEAYFVEGNSRRGIDLGFLVRRNLPFRVEPHSNREVPVDVRSVLGNRMAGFSRDVAELRLFGPKPEPCLILLLTHLKSMLNSEGDPRGKDQRTAEAFALVEIYEKLRGTFPRTPIVLGGDFNASLANLELEPLARSDLRDFHELLGTPELERTSLVYFNSANEPEPRIFDHLLVSPQLRDRIVREASFTFRYRDPYGLPGALPKAQWQRDRQPSDHYPVVLSLRGF